jgi:RNA polymerase sigma factor (sigma-70 family)
LRAGDEETWTHLFCQLWPIALRAAQHPATCLTAPEAEEVANEALALVVPQVQGVQSIDELKALLATVAHRRAISAARAKSAAKRGPATLDPIVDRDPDCLGDADSIASDKGTLNDWQRAELALLLRQAMDKLDPAAQRLLYEKVCEDLSYQQISARHQIPLGTLCTKFARSLQQVRKRLEGAPKLMKELREFLR